MGLPVPSFAALTAGDQPLSLLDQQFTAIALGGTIACTAVGQNTIVLTPNPNNFVPSSYTDGAPRFTWVQQLTTTTGPITINVAGIGPVTGYKQNGAVALGGVAGELVAGGVYTGTFSSVLTAGSGGISVDLNAQGPTGPPGGAGPPGPPGPAGPTAGLPVGGATNQVLAKNSAADYDTSWQTVAGGGVSSWNTRIGAVTMTLADVTGVGGAPIASPLLTGVPTAPTASPGTNTQQLATTQFVNAAVAAAGTGALRSYLAGLTLSTVGAAITFSVAPGVATDSTAARMMSLSASITKSTAAWAAGTNAGALDTGAIANSTWYHVHLITRTDTGAVDVLVSLSPTSPTLPTPYTLFRRIGSMLTNSSGQWTSFSQLGDEFLWLASVGDVNVTNLGTAAVAYTLTVPTGVQVLAMGRIGMTNTGGSGAGANVLVNAPDQNSEVAGAGIGNVTLTNPNNTTTVHTPATIRTNTLAQVRAIASLAATTFQWVTYGWIDRRGRDA